MGFIRGKAQPYESLTPHDYDFFPIWEMAVDEKGVAGQDETWRRPLWYAKDVEARMAAVFVPFDIVGTDLMGVGLYTTRADPEPLVPTPTDDLGEITVWWQDRWIWVGGDDGPELEWPFIARMRPTIEGEAGVCFCVNRSPIRGTRVPSV
ncbi:MAG: hypothetical protein AAF184_11795 [Pseudomonadota bacterium]